MSLIARALDGPKREYEHRNDVINFGKYAGHTIGSVILSDPSYVQWAVDNNAMLLSRELLDELDNAMNMPSFGDMYNSDQFDGIL